MTMKKYILFLFSIFVFTQCSSSHSNNIEKDNCDSIAWKIAYLFNDYQLYDMENKLDLDTIITMLDTAIGQCPKYDAFFSVQRIIVFSFKHDYQQGLKYAELLNDTLVNSTYISSTYKFVVVNRFKAIIAQERGDFLAKNQYINEIIDTLKKQLPDNEIDSVMKFQNADSIAHYKKWVYLQQYYYYRAQIEGVEKINQYLDSKYNDVDNRYLWAIRPQDDDFMIFTGI